MNKDVAQLGLYVGGPNASVLKTMRMITCPRVLRTWAQGCHTPQDNRWCWSDNDPRHMESPLSHNYVRYQHDAFTRFEAYDLLAHRALRLVLMDAVTKRRVPQSVMDALVPWRNGDIWRVVALWQ